jgi:hypothetical protein
MDTTQATAANRVKLYVNGVQVTAFSTATYPSQNFDTAINNNVAQYLGYYNNLGTTIFYYDGYETEINFIDGQALTPTSFGSFNTITGVWQPKAYSGTYGTNGYYLNFQDNSAATAAAIGKDSSGNGNNWTPNGISVTAGVTYDSMTDLTTLTSATQANYAVLNPLFNTGLLGYLPLIDGNLVALESSGSAAWRSRWTTMSMPTGGWYAEFTLSYTGATPITNGTVAVGLHDGGSSTYVGQTTTTYGYFSNGTKYNNGSSTAFGATYANGDVISVAYDPTNGKVWFGKNGTWQASGNPAAGTNPAFSSVPINLFFGCSAFWNSPDGNAIFYANFGQRPFAYTPPTGFVALNTYNLTDSTITNGANQFAATIYTGNSSTNNLTNTVNGTSFQPNFVWIKNRTSALSSYLNDSVRGVYQTLFSNSTAAEYNGTSTSDGVSAFNTNGFTLLNGTNVANYNQSANNYVAWQWKAGGTAVTNTSGSISSQVSANPSAGFSIVTYTGTGANATVGHGLGIAPSMIIVKRRGAVDTWRVYHASLGNTKYLNLNDTTAAGTASTVWNNTSPTSTVFSISTDSAVNSSSAGNTFVAYCFAEIAGYSKFGSYTGNGSADGPFIYTGFKPRFIMIKGSSFVSNWFIQDSARNGYNVNNGVALRPNLTAAEDGTTTYNIDILSNGFKLRSSAADANTNGATFIYVAFAENPFKNSLAR